MQNVKHNTAYQKYNPFRRPDWRWERVLQIIDRYPKPGRCSRRDDTVIRKARHFVLTWRNKEEAERQELFYQNPALCLAYEIFEKQSEDADHALFLQGRLLAGMSSAAIADAMGTLPQVVDWYEAIFFNVRDKLRHRDWITKMILVPSMMRNFGLFHQKSEDHQPAPWEQAIIAKPFMDGSLKMFAYFGGPVLCEFMISGFQQGKICQSPENVGEWLDSHWATTIKARSAQAARTFEINKYNVTELFAVHAQIIQIEKSAESMAQRQSSIEKHVGALIDELEDVWTVGDIGEEGDLVVDGDILRFDNSAAELRDDELLLGTAGDLRMSRIRDVETMALPPPRETPVAAAEDKK